jgi:hypothetical protein
MSCAQSVRDVYSEYPQPIDHPDTRITWRKFDSMAIHAFLLAALTFLAALGPASAKADDTITHKVFFDVTIDGKPAGT